MQYIWNAGFPWGTAAACYTFLESSSCAICLAGNMPLSWTF